MGLQVFLHPRSALAPAAPRMAVYTELLQGEKRAYMSGARPAHPLAHRCGRQQGCARYQGPPHCRCAAVLRPMALAVSATGELTFLQCMPAPPGCDEEGGLEADQAYCRCSEWGAQCSSWSIRCGKQACRQAVRLRSSVVRTMVCRRDGHRGGVAAGGGGGSLPAERSPGGSPSVLLRRRRHSALLARCAPCHLAPAALLPRSCQSVGAALLEQSCQHSIAMFTPRPTGSCTECRYSSPARVDDPTLHACTRVGPAENLLLARPGHDMHRTLAGEASVLLDRMVCCKVSTASTPIPKSPV